MLDTLKAILVSFGAVALLAGVVLLQLAPWLLAFYVLVCLIFGIPMIPPGV